MDKFVIRKPRELSDKPSQSLTPSSDNEFRDLNYDAGISSSDADYDDRAGLSLSVESTADCSTNSSQNTEKEHENKAKGKCGRTFQQSWKRKFEWLFYENEKQRTFCSICTTASDDGMPLPTSPTQISSFKCFVEDGFGNWKKALEKFQSHEKSDFHRAAVSMVSSKGKQSVTQLISSDHTKQMKQNRVALVKIFTSLRYLGHQGLPIRGKTEEESNLITLLNERKDDVVELDVWLKRTEKFKWLSPEISDEILTDFNRGIL